MPLIKAILLPHSPLLIPEIGRANHSFLSKTTEVYKEVAEELKNKGVETIIIISPHALAQDNEFLLNIAPEMLIDLKDFGFILNKTALQGDSLLADQIKNSLKANSDFTTTLVSEETVDYGSAIPAYLLKNIIGDYKLLVIAPAKEKSLDDIYLYGQKLKEILNTSEKNIALIASGDLSHRLKKKSPAGYSPKGAKFDNKLIEYLSDAKSAATNIIKMDKKLIKNAGECGLKPIIMTLGVLDEINWQPEILAYQPDFGIGYLSLNFKLPNEEMEISKL